MHAAEEIVKRTVIWDTMALVWSYRNDNAAKRDSRITNDYVSNEKKFMFPLLLARYVVEQTIEWLRIWHFMTLLWGNCYNNALKRDFSITNDFVPNQDVWIFILLSVMAYYWANCGDFGRHDARVSSL